MSKVIDIASQEIGTTEEPKNSNTVKYNNWFWNKTVSGTAYAWCGVFVSWCFWKAGIPLPSIGYTRGFAATNYAMENVHKWGRVVSKSEVRPGDVVFFDWDGNKSYEHCGIFERDNGNGVNFTSIEGNTSFPKEGMSAAEMKQANSNGGAVLRRTDRKYSQATFVRPNVINTLA